MQENTELLATAPTQALPIIGEVLEESGPVKEVCTQDRDVELAQLVACIAADVKRSKKRVTIYKRVFAAVSIPSVFTLLTFMLAPLFLGIPGSFDNHVAGVILHVAGTCCCAMLGVFAGLFWLRLDHRSEQERTAARRLVEMDDVRAVAPLIDTVHWVTQWVGNRPLRSELWQAFGRLLPRMTEEDVRELGQERLGIVVTWIEGWDVPLVQKPFEDDDNQPLLGMLHVMRLVAQHAIPMGQTRTRKSRSLLPILET
ncbi:MAG: hypothetical protein JWN14_855 [Chthonomonadales bacterium]|nr:hypothetical protein [Chthonomonadales bacterium]